MTLRDRLEKLIDKIEDRHSEVGFRTCRDLRPMHKSLLDLLDAVSLYIDHESYENFDKVRFSIIELRETTRKMEKE